MFEPKPTFLSWFFNVAVGIVGGILGAAYLVSIIFALCDLSGGDSGHEPVMYPHLSAGILLTAVMLVAVILGRNSYRNWKNGEYRES